MKRILFVLSAFVMLLCPARLPAAALQAGVARIDITPPIQLKAPLGGYGERMSKPAIGVHDRIFAKALAVFDGSRSFVVVTADMIGFPPTFKPEIVRELADPKITLENLLLLPSHSHTSVEMNAFHPGNQYNIPQIGIYNSEVHKFLLAQFCHVVRHACQNPVPVRIGTSSQQIPGWNRNRRHQGGFTDDELTLTRVDTLDGKSLAVLVNFAAHPTFLSAEQMEFSGDWPGQLQRSLESLIGQGTTVMYFNGAEGDQAPVARPDSGSSPWEKSDRYGGELALAAWRVFLITETRTDVAFEFHRQEIELPATSWHPQFMETGGKEYGLTEEILKEMLPSLFPKTTASVTLRLGDLLIVGIPGEMAAELGRMIKQRASQRTGAAYPVIGGLADEWDSYILPAAEYRWGGYEASVSFYGETLGATIVEGALRGVSELPDSQNAKQATSSNSSPRDAASLSVAVVQMRSTKNLAENVRRMQGFIADAAKKGSRVVLFPECSLSGYFDDEFMRSLTRESLDDAERQICETCRQQAIFAIVGAPTRDGDTLYNSALVIDSSGKIVERYHKLQLAEGWPTPGDHLSVFSIDGVLCSIIICHDERYPELVRVPVLAGARVVFYLSHESGLNQEEKINPYRAQIQARAVENSVYVLQANAPANLDQTGSHGQSRIVAPDGSVKSEASVFEEDVLPAVLDLNLATRQHATRSVTRGLFVDWYQDAIRRVRVIAP